MSIPVLQEFLLPQILAYLINLASGERSAAFADARAAKINSALDDEEALKRALASSRSIRDEIRLTCTQLAVDQQTVGEEATGPLWHIFSDAQFQSDVADWLMVGSIEEGRAAKDRLISSLEYALTAANASEPTKEFVRIRLFDRLEKVVFNHPLLARWRHQLSLDYLREQVASLKVRAEEAAGSYSPERQSAALDRYCDKALAAWDIIDLSNLPEGDIHMATQKLLLRQLYMPLRIEVEPDTKDGADDEALARIEARREALRRRAAGHTNTGARGDPQDSKGLAIGAIMDDSLRLVVLGDPGGGKTTMLRWMATAFLLQHNQDAAFAELPDAETLPKQSWIPVLIRCRDLGDTDLCRSFTDFLTQHLKKTELLPDEAEVMCAVILDLIAKGRVLLLVDGLDEISSPQVRVQFCQEIERTATRYPAAAIVVTSRIVGYRDMPYRMGSGFQHGQIADLSRSDKDLFAARWVEVTEHQQTATERKRRAEDLLNALHSSDRIERLTGNPMLLTTLALVKRKVGKLPNKRSKLYQEAVSVLLNWNPSRYETIDEDEALPQLEFLAYEMCRLGVQRLTEDDVLQLLERLRLEYPNVRAAKRRTPEQFLALLEARSSILIKAGGVWQTDAIEKQVWEFRHLTFQEYLAARAILDGKYPGRNKALSLADQVAPLAGAVQQSEAWKRHKYGEEWEHSESWREALRLLLVECPDDDVDAVLLAILMPLDGEDGKTNRPRAVLAGLCLVDEPNVDESTVLLVLQAFAREVRTADDEHEVTPLYRAALQIGAGIWSPIFKECLVHEFCSRPDETRWHSGSMWGNAAFAAGLVGNENSMIDRLSSTSETERIAAALEIMCATYAERASDHLTERLKDPLFTMVAKGGAETRASVWALVWLSGGWLPNLRHGGDIGKTWEVLWQPSEHDASILAEVLKNAAPDEIHLKSFLLSPLGRVPCESSFYAAMSMARDPSKRVRGAAIDSLVTIGDLRCLALLRDLLSDSDLDVRIAAIHAFGKLGQPAREELLIARLNDEDPTVRAAAAQVLGATQDLAVVQPLLAQVGDEDSNVRSSVLRALVRIGGEEAKASLRGQLEDLTDLASKVWVAAALHHLGVSEGTVFLQSATSSNDVEIYQVAVGACAELGDEITRRLLWGRTVRAIWRSKDEVLESEALPEIATRFSLSVEEVKKRYEHLATVLNLRLGWQQSEYMLGPEPLISSAGGTNP